MSEMSEGSLLGGRVTYRQFLSGHRSGFEPVLLAAAVAAKPGELVLDAGTGAGAALLCLGSRVADVRGVGAEIDRPLAALAQENFKNNKLYGIRAVQCDATSLPFGAVFKLCMTNPPWHNAASSTSPDANRALAHQAKPALLTAWLASLTKALKPRGTLTIIIPAASLAEAIAALKSVGCGGVTLLPLWPRAGQEAKQIIISAKRGANAPDRLVPGLILHDETGISAAAQAILRDGERI